MEQAIIQVGFPVKCAWGDCITKGLVKPGTDHGGWVRRSRKSWYCPKHAEEAQAFYDSIVELYKTPPPVSEPETPEQELYALID